MNPKTLIGHFRTGSVLRVRGVADRLKITGRISGALLVRTDTNPFPFTIAADTPVVEVIYEPPEPSKKSKDETDPLTYRLSNADVPLFSKGDEDDE